MATPLPQRRFWHRLKAVAWYAVLLALAICFGRFAWPRLTLRAAGGFDAAAAIYEQTKPPPDKDVGAALDDMISSLPAPPYESFGLFATLQGEWSPTDRPVLADAIHYLGLPELRQKLVELHGLSRGSVSAATPAGISRYQTLRHLIRLPVANLRWAANQDPVPFDEFVRDLETSLNLTRMCYEHTWLLGMLVGISCDALAMAQLQHAVDDAPLDAGQLRILLATIRASALPRRPPLRAITRAGQSLLERQLHELYVVRPDGNGWLDLASVASAPDFGIGFGNNCRAALWRSVNLLSVVFYDLSTVKQEFARLFDAYAVAEDLPGPQALAAIRAVDEQVASLIALYGPTHQYWGPQERAFELCQRTLIAREACQTLIALRIRQFEHDGNLPDTLDALVPHVLPALPLDWYSGDSLVYRRNGRDFLLYSVGPDGRDDGGDPGDKNDWERDPDHVYPEQRWEAHDEVYLRSRPEHPWKDYDPYPGNVVEDYSRSEDDPEVPEDPDTE